jgi:FAD/FMN-containing dehydrogenase
MKIIILANLLSLIAASGLTDCLFLIPATDGTTIAPENPSFPLLSLGVNYAFNYKPSAVFQASSIPGVSAAVKCAKLNNVVVAPRSGAHSYEGYSQGGQHGSLIIDLKDLNSVVVDAAASTAKIGPGVKMSSLYYQLWIAGEYAFPGGSCPTVGLGGYLLGGGFGFMTRMFGTGLDQIIEMQLVDANGELKVVSEASEPELFWALRGAGSGNFGVVVEVSILNLITF